MPSSIGCLSNLLLLQSVSRRFGRSPSVDSTGFLCHDDSYIKENTAPLPSLIVFFFYPLCFCDRPFALKFFEINNNSLQNWSNACKPIYKQNTARLPSSSSAHLKRRWMQHSIRIRWRMFVSPVTQSSLVHCSSIFTTTEVCSAIFSFEDLLLRSRGQSPPEQLHCLAGRYQFG